MIVIVMGIKNFQKTMSLMIHEYIFKTKLQFIPLKFEVILIFFL